MKFFQDLKIESGILHCPNCGHSEMHHDRVDVWEAGEMAPNGTALHVSVRGVDALESFGSGRPRLPPIVAVDANEDGNPSSRRQGLSIRLWCEGCHWRSKLTIAQHKGCTLVEHEAIGPSDWSFDPETDIPQEGDPF